MQIVIAKHAVRRVAEALHKTQHPQRLRPAIDKITGKPEVIALRIKRYFSQQRQQLVVAALHVANGVNRHVVPLINLGCNDLSACMNRLYRQVPVFSSCSRQISRDSSLLSGSAVRPQRNFLPPSRKKCSQVWHTPNARD